MAVEGGGGGGEVADGLLGARGTTVVEGGGGDGGKVVRLGLDGAEIVGGVIGGDGGGGEQVLAWFPPKTVTSLSVMLTLEAHEQRLHDVVPSPIMVARLPFRLTGRVTTGKPPSPAERPSVVTA